MQTNLNFIDRWFFIAAEIQEQLELRLQVQQYHNHRPVHVVGFVPRRSVVYTIPFSWHDFFPWNIAVFIIYFSHKLFVRNCMLCWEICS